MRRDGQSLRDRVQEIDKRSQAQQDQLEIHGHQIKQLQTSLGKYVPQIEMARTDSAAADRRIGDLQAAVDDLQAAVDNLKRRQRRVKWSFVVDLALWITLLALLVANNGI